MGFTESSKNFYGFFLDTSAYLHVTKDKVL